MTIRPHLLAGLFVAMMCAPANSACADDRPAADVVRVRLRPQANVTERLITIGDIAQIEGGTPSARQRIAQLDLVELDVTRSKLQVTSTLVQARLLLSGTAPDAFRVEGAAVTEVHLQVAQSAEHRAIRAAREAVAQRLSLPPDEVVVHLAQPLSEESIQLVSHTAPEELEARLATTAGGRTRVELWTSDDRQQRRVTPIAVEVRFRQYVPVAARPLSARQTLTADDIVLEPREVTQRGAWLTPEDISGKALRRSLSPGEIVTERDLMAAIDKTEPPMIKPRDLVRLTARKGKLTLVVPAAEALQAGREGEMIRVRNTSSGRVVLGRVVAPGEVEVPL